MVRRILKFLVDLLKFFTLNLSLLSDVPSDVPDVFHDFSDILDLFVSLLDVIFHLMRDSSLNSPLVGLIMSQS